LKTNHLATLAQSFFRQKLIHQFYHAKKWAKSFGLLQSFSETPPRENSPPIVENSPDRVTLLRSPKKTEYRSFFVCASRTQAADFASRQLAAERERRSMSASPFSFFLSFCCCEKFSVLLSVKTFESVLTPASSRKSVVAFASLLPG
jgi:hypothetical protein